MLKKAKQSLIQKGVYTSPTAEAEKSAKLRIERQQLEKENVEITKTLDEKRKSLNLDHNAFDKIEKEHLARVEELQNKIVDLINLVDNKSAEHKNISLVVSDLRGVFDKLKVSIPELKDKKGKLEVEFKDLVDKFNTEKANGEVYLSALRDKSDKTFIELSGLEKSVDEAKKELKSTLEKIDEENKVLSVRKKDLEIYEARLRKKYPNDKIIL
jgi:chromosome segregation ATPase